MRQRWFQQFSRKWFGRPERPPGRPALTKAGSFRPSGPRNR